MLTIVAEMPEAAGKALAYGDGHLDTWAEEALGASLECDCGDSDTTWAADVERLFGFRYEDAREAFNVVEARIEDMDGPEKSPVQVDFDAEEWEALEAAARESGETPKAYFSRHVKEWLAGERKEVDAAGGGEIETAPKEKAADDCEINLELPLHLVRRLVKIAERDGVGLEDTIIRLLAEEVNQ